MDECTRFLALLQLFNLKNTIKKPHDTIFMLYNIFLTFPAPSYII